MGVGEHGGKQQTVLRKLANDLLSGGLAGIVSKTIIAPVERVKLLLQVQHASTQIAPHERYKGMSDCFKRVYKEQGLLSFWRGNLANVTRYFPGQALNFTIWDRFRDAFLSDAPAAQTDFWRYLARSVAVGGAAGAASLVVLYPFDFARTRVGVDVGVGAQRLYAGSVDCLRRVVRAEGWRGVFRGFDAALVGVFAWRGLYFGCYDAALVRAFAGDRRGGTVAQRWLLAQAVTTAAGTAVYPLDTLRRRMMMQAGRADVLYAGSWHCARTVAREEGVRGFYRGLSANLVRGVGGALMLVLFDEIRVLMG
ncbi:mitochondrial ADP/ATP translocator [Tribonema minus]|uniref:ADP/ATP translocase n=1 Tax=Tribonema minus TaxID=303371 RepID=A0A836CGY1_9STRA|nr:mitochondrial ADP/ATP translocator [Tribonema minus]